MLITIEGIAEDEKPESLTKYSGNKPTITTQIGAPNEPLEKLNDNLIKIMTILESYYL